MIAEETKIKKAAVKKAPMHAKKSKTVRGVAQRPSKSPAEKEILPKPLPAGKYYEAIGRRKTAIARVRILSKNGGEFVINDKPLDQYFADFSMREIAQDALKKMNCLEQFSISAKVKGGGLHAQSQALRHGISRALILFSPDFRKRLKKAGFLTRDPRMRERKKFGLKRARRAPQWQKR